MRHTTKVALIALFAAGAVAATSVGASALERGHGMRGQAGPMAGPGDFMKMEFADIDIDGSGQITVEDLMAMGKARFAEADANGDGVLDQTEMVARVQVGMAERAAKLAEAGREMRRQPTEQQLGWMAEKMIARRDTDKSGTLSLEELAPDTAKLERLIDRFDTDDDNAISAAEFDTAQKEIWQRGAKRGGRTGGGKRN